MLQVQDIGNTFGRWPPGSATDSGPVGPVPGLCGQGIRQTPSVPRDSAHFGSGLLCFDEFRVSRCVQGSGIDSRNDLNPVRKFRWLVALSNPKPKTANSKLAYRDRSAWLRILKPSPASTDQPHS